MVSLFKLQYLDQKSSYHYNFGIIGKLNICSCTSYKYFGPKADHDVLKRKNAKNLGHLDQLFFQVEGTHVTTPVAFSIIFIDKHILYFWNSDIFSFHLVYNNAQ